MNFAEAVNMHFNNDQDARDHEAKLRDKTELENLEDMKNNERREDVTDEEAEFRRDTDAGVRGIQRPERRDPLAEIREDLKLLTPERKAQIKADADEVKDWCAKQVIALDKAQKLSSEYLAPLMEKIAGLDGNAAMWQLRNMASQGQRDLFINKRMHKKAILDQEYGARRGDWDQVNQATLDQDQAAKRMVVGFLTMEMALAAWDAISAEHAEPLISRDPFIAMVRSETNYQRRQNERNEKAKEAASFVASDAVDLSSL